ncbi:MAG: hypothetical protein ACLRM5_10215 [Escherichia coli]
MYPLFGTNACAQLGRSLLRLRSEASRITASHNPADYNGYKVHRE